ncbi:Ubiquitin carboxyl-terminal hydrolase 24-like isoform X3 [Oopsacas minuta]|uniref:Ubiquitin carboxyl-terminal hydrolase 24-like isoform X3 n=1 Tax=Oopsacas minuta TaxID=111878 RepID=A0AAV7K6V7_9METZ|nr:Ubiquitin carboxyl-terminal hydrolase 24-like isoform X3 [Oopsacas minuta]
MVEGARHLLSHNAFNCLLNFLLGPSSIGPTGQYNRRWTPQQLKEWHNFYGVLCNLVIVTNTKSVWSTEPTSRRPSPTNLNLPQDIIPISSDMTNILYHESTERFMKECLLTLRSMSESEVMIVDFLCDIMCHACWCCEEFSFKLIDELQHSLSSFMSNEIKYLFRLLDDIMSLRDPFQEKRVLYLFNLAGTKKNNYGLNDIAFKNKDHDPRRSYLCIKFFVKLFNNFKCTFAKQFLREHAEVWKWSIPWLKGKLKDTHSWSAVSSVSNETSSTTTLQRTYSAQDTLEEVTAIISPKIQEPSVNRKEIQPNLQEEINTADSTSQPDMAPFQPNSVYEDKGGMH